MPHSMRADCLIRNANLATMDPDQPTPYGAIHKAAVAIRNGRIIWLGQDRDHSAVQARETIDARGQWMTPGLIDCHTHLVYGGNRAQEFEQRLQGVSYEEIARQGGGILSTVNATRNASESQLLASAETRLHRLMEEGVTTVEIKSGYGLTKETEMKMLRVARQLGQTHPVTVRTTFLGAHATPPEFIGRSDAYIDYVCGEMLDAVCAAGLADAADVFCEKIAFSTAQAQRVLQAARSKGLALKGHVEQLSDSGGARMLASMLALSADHLEYLSAADAALMAQSETVAVILPGAYYFLQQEQRPPIEALRQYGCAMAVATDTNPGSCPAPSILTAMNQACVLFGLTPEEALAGTTRHAATALGLGLHKGQLRSGFDADMLLWPISHPAELSYAINAYRPTMRWHGGQTEASQHVQ